VIGTHLDYRACKSSKNGFCVQPVRSSGTCNLCVTEAIQFTRIVAAQPFETPVPGPQRLESGSILVPEQPFHFVEAWNIVEVGKLPPKLGISNPDNLVRLVARVRDVSEEFKRVAV
jgi:hypothetical protein